MEFRQLRHCGLRVSVLSLGAGTFGGGTEFFKAWGASDVAEATRLVDVCLEGGVNLFDTADICSRDLSEESLGRAIAGKRILKTPTAHETRSSAASYPRRAPHQAAP